MSKVEDIFQAVADELGINYYEIAGINQSFSNPDYPYCKVETRSYGDFFIEGARCLRMMEAVEQRKEIEPVTAAKSECCNKDPKAIGWNPYNEVVQCHHCGHVYVLKEYTQEVDDARLKQMVAEKFGILPYDAEKLNLGQVIAVASKFYSHGAKMK